MADTTVSVKPFGLPTWSRVAAIGDYDGAFDKEDSAKEGKEPYAAQWYRELHASRGSAYTQKPRTLVDAENLAIARMMGAVFSRTPEKFRANLTPLRADEKLEYWIELLGIPTAQGEQRWQWRDRCVVHYRATSGPVIENIRTACSTLLGDAFVDLHLIVGVDLDTPPTNTFWPVFNPGSSDNDLGGGAWSSERCHLFVEVQIPPGMLQGDFLELVNVQLFQLLDRLLPIYCTFAWAVTSTGFFLDTSDLDFDALVP